MANEEIRVGLIGAGKNTRDRHIPGFHQVDGVEIAAVANRSRESGRVVADQFNIPTVYDSWQELLEDESINAVCIGTWPYVHRTLTIAALEAGKHVLTEARMAANGGGGAREMLDASRAQPGLVTQIVPSPLTFKVDNLLQPEDRRGLPGRRAGGLSVQSLYAGIRRHRRSRCTGETDRDLSGYNILNMGIWYEAMIRWVGPATRVMANTKRERTPTSRRRREPGACDHPRPRGHPGRLGQRGAGEHALQRGHRLRRLVTRSGSTAAMAPCVSIPALNVYGGQPGRERHGRDCQPA